VFCQSAGERKEKKPNRVQVPGTGGRTKRHNKRKSHKQSLSLKKTDQRNWGERNSVFYQAADWSGNHSWKKHVKKKVNGNANG